MGKLSNSLKELVYGRQSSPTPVGPVNDDPLPKLRSEVDQIGRFLMQKIDELTLAAKESEDIAKNQIQHSEESVESLWQQLAVLESKLQEAEKTFRQKDAAIHKLDDTLRGEIHNLQDELKKNQGELEGKGDEINALKSKIDNHVSHVAELESVILQHKSDAAKEVADHKHIVQTLEENIDLVQVQLRATEEIIRGKDSTLQKLEQELTVKIQEFENEIKNKEQLLTARDAEIRELKAELQFLTRGIKGTSSFFRQAETLAHAHPEENIDFPIDPVNGEGQSSLASSSATTAEETVSPEFFDRATEHLTLSIGPMAPIILRDHIEALGESTKNFPKRRVVELIEMLSNEISNNDLRLSFRNWFASAIFENLHPTTMSCTAESI
jgi:myosin heavy subunit